MAKRIKIAFVILVAILIVAYAFASLSPHSHDCAEADCMLCAMAESIRNALSGTPQLIGFCISVFVLLCLKAYPFIAPTRDGTPVGLKVKLSD